MFGREGARPVLLAGAMVLLSVGAAAAQSAAGGAGGAAGTGGGVGGDGGATGLPGSSGGAGSGGGAGGTGGSGGLTAFTGTALPTSAKTGGNAGFGAASGETMLMPGSGTGTGGSGGGGGGGFGAIVNSTNATDTLSVNVSGGFGGGGGISAPVSSGSSNAGSGGAAGAGGGGLYYTGSNLTVAGLVEVLGGAGGTGGFGGDISGSGTGNPGRGGAAGDGGAGLTFASGGTLNNNGLIFGGRAGQGGLGGSSSTTFGIANHNGAAGGNGAAAVEFGGLIFNNSGFVTGGAGGDGQTNANGGNGGAGVRVTSSATVNNMSSIVGGAGGLGGAGLGTGGTGGAGVMFDSGGILVNRSSINGGNGGGNVGSGGMFGGALGVGGVGVTGANLTVINNGIISGGLAPDDVTRANAIQFSGGINTLQLQFDSIISGHVVAFSAADTFQLGGSTDATFDASAIGSQYLGFGLFQKVGTATWTLTGGNAAALPWTISAGTLQVNGAMANSTMNVLSGGTLAGAGTVGATTINNGGTLAPGPIGGIGTLTISGNLMLASAATYMVQVTPAVASQTVVNGSATLGGTVDAVFTPGSYVAKQYTILTATAGINGTFGGLTNIALPAGFTDSLSYSGNSAFLNLTANLGTGTGGLNQNQQNVASALNNFFNGGGALPPNFVSIFGLTGASLQNALSQLDGETATDAEKGAFQFMTEYLSLMLDPFAAGRGGAMGGGATGFAPEQTASFPPDIALAYGAILKAPPPSHPSPVSGWGFEQRWTAWGASFGGYNKTNGDPTLGTNTVTARDFGFAGGMDYHFLPDTLAGFSLAGGGTNWGLAQGLGTGRSDAFSGGVYAKTRSGPWYLAGALAFADHWFTTNRTAAFGDQLRANFNGQSFGGRAEAGYRYAVQPMIGITPYAALQAQSFHTPRYSETDLTGGGFGLTYNAMNATDTRGELGARFDDLTMLNAMPLVLRARLAWAHDGISNPALGAVFQALPGASFIVNGAAPPKDSALTTAAAELHMTTNWSLAAKFDGEFARNAQTYAGTGTLRYVW